jgi:CRP/FNR family transcriptional regulator, polysaccharide utilization system transcription regulator
MVNSTDKENVSCHNCENWEKSLFADLPDDEKKIIDSGRENREYKKGKLIFREGNLPTGIICLKKGKVKIFKKGNSGREQIIRLSGEIEMIGYRALFAEERYRSSALTLEDSLVCHIHKDHVFRVMEKNNVLTRRILILLAQELGDAKDRLINLTQKHVRGRLADALLILHKTFGQCPFSETLNINFSRNDLASLANMTTSNASRTLSVFAEEKLVDVYGRTIRILELEKLKEVSKYG